MQLVGGRYVYGASDLNNFLECKRLTELDGLLVRNLLARPPAEDDEHAELIKRKGEEHERNYLEQMRARHRDRIVAFERPQAGLDAFLQAEQRTFEAMRAGVPMIYQATFFDGEFIGHADFLRRIEVASQLGDWSYEVIDTKLALSPKAYFLLQLCNYSEHLERLQGRMPEYGAVVLGDGDEQRFRLGDYLAYYRHVKAAFRAFVADTATAQANAPREYPYECKHCGICPWQAVCAEQRVRDDHLGLVAWMRRDQIAKFEKAGITTVTALADARDDERPDAMNPETFEKLRRQAALQVRGRGEGPVYALIEHAPPMGFALLPHPAPGDVFFDIEGDPLYEPGRGLEYLFGLWMPGEESPYRAFWASGRTEEKQRFEECVDFLCARRRAYSSMHVYHYATYEKGALRRLAQVHCTREDEIDELLRGEVFIDLFAVVRQAIAISEDGYSLKNIERFYDLQRKTETKKGDESIVMFERWLQDKAEALRADIIAYNKDDCYSTYLLRSWLLERRAEAIARFGVDLPLRAVKELPKKEEDPEEARRSELERALLRDVLAPETEHEYREMSADRRMRFLLANAMAYFRREEKPAWWAYFHRIENLDELLEFDKEAIAGLRLQVAEPKRKTGGSNLIYAYTFPEQHHKMGPGDAVNPRTRKSATIVEIDDENGTLLLELGKAAGDPRSVAELIPPGPPQTTAQRGSLTRIAQWFLEGVLPERSPATLDLLASRNPCVAGSGADEELQPERVSAESVSRAVRSLERSYLFVQGPPGSGKSTIGSEVIADLLDRGKRVAVMSRGHKAVHHLLQKVEEAMLRRGQTFRGIYKHSRKNPGSEYVSVLAAPFVVSLDSNDEVESGDYQLAGGTAWLFSRPKLVRAFDYLFIDEAGQVSLADALAVSPCAENIVLLGDPSQLAQVNQGTHPLHVDDSILVHLLGDAQTVPAWRGIFLDVSHRMQPAICTFVSDAMYERRLRAADETALHAITVGGERRAGLRYQPIAHTGNSSSSPEEADWIVGEIVALRQGILVDSQPAKAAGVPRSIEDRDIIVITPYNAQRRLIARKLGDAGLDVRVGTVDKFQGLEAAVVFYSMATSSGDEVPRENFLFERNRFNVAISRARALSVLVCSPRLLDISARTPDEMALVNVLCAFVEQATLPGNAASARRPLAAG